MAETVSFRPNIDTFDDFQMLLRWCEVNESSFNSIINSILPALVYTLQNDTRKIEGKNYMRCDWGDIELREPGPYIRRHH